MVYTVTMNPAIDYVVRLRDALKPGGINRSSEEVYQFGGKGINVSNVLKTLGIDTVALGFAAGFTGEALENGLRQMGLNTELIHTAEGMTRINVKVKTDMETEINGTGPMITAVELEQLFAKLDRLAEGDTLILSGSVPPCLPADVYAQILERLTGRAVRTVVDAEGELLRHALKYRPFLIKPNRQELSQLSGRELYTEDMVLKAAQELQRQGARNVLVSLAGEGALLLDENGTVRRIGCPQGTVRNSVGAGDSMVAGFLAGWLERADYDHALRLGTAAGSAAAFSEGLPERMVIDALFAELA